jgi:flagellar protein FliJ
MARFKFRMAMLLKLREAARDERRAELAKAYRADEVLAENQGRVDAEMRAMAERCRKAVGPGPIDLDVLIGTHRYEIMLKTQQRHLSEQRAKLAEEIERRRLALLAANRDVRVLEKLREHQLEQHNQAEYRADIKRLDEVGRLQAITAEEVV